MSGAALPALQMEVAIPARASQTLRDPWMGEAAFLSDVPRTFSPDEATRALCDGKRRGSGSSLCQAVGFSFTDHCTHNWARLVRF